MAEAKDRLEADLATLSRELMPVDGLPIEQLPAPQALGRAALGGLQQLIRIIEQPLDLDDLKQQRLVGDMSVAACKLFMRAAEGEFQARKQGALEQLLAEIRAAKEK
jgi:hypothetical protein